MLYAIITAFYSSHCLVLRECHGWAACLLIYANGKASWLVLWYKIVDVTYTNHAFCVNIFVELCSRYLASAKHFNNFFSSLDLPSELHYLLGFLCTIVLFSRRSRHLPPLPVDINTMFFVFRDFTLGCVIKSGSGFISKLYFFMAHDEKTCT